MKSMRIVLLAALLVCLGGQALGQTVERGGAGATVILDKSSPATEPSVERSTQQGRRPGSQETGSVIITGERLLGIGWERFKSGDWEQAHEAFAQALQMTSGEAQLRARIGLGYAEVRLGRLQEARENFRKVVDADFETKDTLPAFLTVLRALGDKKGMEIYLAKLPENQRAQWSGAAPAALPEPSGGSSPAQTGLRAEFAKAGGSPSVSRLEALLSKHSSDLGSCSDSDIFLKIAQGLTSQGQAPQAKPVLGKLLSCPRLDFGIRMGAYYELAAITDPDIVRDYLRRFQDSAKGLTAKERQALGDLAAVLDKKEMGRTGISKDKKLQLARSILARSPGDPDARAALAWDRLDRGDTAAALEAFQELRKEYPGRADLALGLGYGLYHSDRLGEALDVALAGDPDDPNFKNLAYQVYVKQAFDAVKAKDYASAARLTDKARAIWPDGAEIREVAAWTAFGTGDYAKAYSLFEERYKVSGDKRFLSPMVLALSRSGQRVRAFETAATLAGAGDAESRKAAAAFYRQEKAPILAAGASAGQDECCANADTQMADARGFARSKTGDSGLSRLTEWAAPVGYSWASANGWRIGAVLTTSYVTSGDAPSSPYAGSSYARTTGVPQRNSLVTDVTLLTPELSLDLEGPYRWRLQAGTTPIGGPVGILPTALANVSTPTWELQVHQKPVSESILSWIGQRDPYGSGVWGRVVRVGGQGAYVFTPYENWFLSLGGGADYLYGENVAGNTALKGNVSGGRTFSVQDNELALGVFSTLKHFDRNENFYTYGNGGYYSPDLLFIAGPFVRFRSPECRDYWFDLDGSLGYMYESTAGAAKYPLTGASTAGLNAAQLSDLNGSYSGKTESKFSYSGKGEALKLLSPYLAAGVFGGISRASDYTEAYGGLGLRFYFDPQKGFWAPKSLFRYYTPLDRD